VVETTTGPDAVFDRFFAGYDKAFVLPNEKEDRDGFVVCFQMNEGAPYARLRALYGPFSEVSLVASDASGDEIGGANFIAMPSDDGAAVTANLNYIYIHAAQRRKGHFARLYEAVRETIAAIYAAPETLVFIEQNDPLRMSPDDYARDTSFSGLDQYDRLRIWAKLGAKVVDFSYKQPPLSADQGVDDTLLYSVLGASGDAISACLLEGHLRRFFGVSVLKGADLSANAAAHEQTAALKASCAKGERIVLLDPRALLAKVHRPADAARLWAQAPGDFRAALRTPEARS
jgi:hypothetical protein